MWIFHIEVHEKRKRTRVSSFIKKTHTPEARLRCIVSCPGCRARSDMEVGLFRRSFQWLYFHMWIVSYLVEAFARTPFQEIEVSTWCVASSYAFGVRLIFASFQLPGSPTIYKKKAFAVALPSTHPSKGAHTQEKSLPRDFRSHRSLRREPDMKPQVLLITLALVAVLAALPLAECQGETFIFFIEMLVLPISTPCKSVNK